MSLFRNAYIEKAIALICTAAALVSALTLIFIVGYLFIRALPALNLQFVIGEEFQSGSINGAIGSALAGTFLISLLATIIATPLGVGTAVYLARYAKKNRLNDIFRFLIEVLAGTPSIVLGIFGFLVFVVYMKQVTGGYSLISGALGLSVLIIPVIARASEESINTISRELEEGSYALGADKWQTTWKITIPAASAGIITGIILGFGRAAEESAVVLFTTAYSQYMPRFAITAHETMVGGIKIYPLQDLVGTLPLSVYNAYEHGNIVPEEYAFATAFVLICFVLVINVTAKVLLSYGINRNNGSNKSFFQACKHRITALQRKGDDQQTIREEGHLPASEKQADACQSGANSVQLDFSCPDPFRKWISMAFPKREPQNINLNDETNGVHIPGNRPTGIRSVTSHLLPFLIPTILLAAIAALATLSPLRHALGPASPGLATSFGIGLAGIIVLAGIAFGLVFARKAGAFRMKNRKAGRIAVAAGIAILLLAGIACAATAPGFFSPADAPATHGDNEDRQARLAALMAQMEAAGGDGQDAGSTGSGSSVEVSSLAGSGGVAGQAGGDQQSAALGSGTVTVTVPVKDALSLGESYRYGDATRTCEATVYDYTVLPQYFWWFIDYNRFVQQVPREGNSYLIVFVRIENLGTQSALVPSADKIRVMNNGKIYKHDPYFNKSVLSTWQTDYYSTRYAVLPYQWIREIGQDKRDYAYLTGYNIFGDWQWISNVTPTVTTTTTATFNATGRNTTSNNGTGFYLKPGPGNAIDGYLVFEVPDPVLKEDIGRTTVEITFNANSASRWRLTNA